MLTFLDRFPAAKLAGVNLTILQTLEDWDPFDLPLERGNSRNYNPDISLGLDAKLVPVVRRVLIDAQPE
jgi:hypothetical protein